MKISKNFDNKIKNIQEILISWYKTKNERKFLWREFIFSNSNSVVFNNKKIDRDYALFIAEFMLIRTKAEQVEQVYKKFLEQFNSFKEINEAHSNELDFLKKLGLKRRIIQLKKLSKNFEKNEIPDKLDELLKLHGIGHYSASAYLCFAKGKNIPLVDSNFVRLYLRIYGIVERGEMRRKKSFLHFSEKILPDSNFKEYNLAVLDLASTVCLSNPKCNICPLKSFCEYSEYKKLLKNRIIALSIPQYDHQGTINLLKLVTKTIQKDKNIRAIFLCISSDNQIFKKIRKILLCMEEKYDFSFYTSNIGNNLNLIPGIKTKDNLYLQMSIFKYTIEVSHWKKEENHKKRQFWVNCFNELLFSNKR